MTTLEIEPVTLQLQQHRFSTLSQSIASLEPTPINVRIACGKPPQNTNSIYGRSPHKNFRPMGAAPRYSEALSCPEHNHCSAHAHMQAIEAICSLTGYATCKAWQQPMSMLCYGLGIQLQIQSFSLCTHLSISPAHCSWA